ncbi:MAG TPA: polysaccharide biosynthesis tyrosine autokinase [Candidatus Binatia bacterium]|nr:polysaccharide biosynthesis tyrosine autokinase [Candidatus Binatia bacterium]
MREPRTPRLEPPEDIEDAEYVSLPDSEKFHIRSYWKILVQRRRLVLLVFVIVVGIGFYIAATSTPVYTARATLKIEPQAPALTGLGDFLNAQSSQTVEYFQTQYALLENRALAASVINYLGLERNKAFTSVPIVTSSPTARVTGWFFSVLQPILNAATWFTNLLKSTPVPTTPTQPAVRPPAPTSNVSPALIGRYLSFLKVKPVKNTRLVQIEFTTPDAQLSQNLANGHAEAFIRLNIQSQFELTKDARDFLDKKNAELKAKLEKSEQALNEFRQKHGVVSLDKGENVLVDRFVEVNRTLTGAQMDRLQAESLYRVVQNKDPQYISQVTKDGLVQQLRSSIVALEAEKTRLSSVYKPDHPRMAEITGQINEARRRLDLELNHMVRNIESSFATARAREAALQAEADKLQERALNLKELGVQYVVLQEEVNVSRSMYESVLKRLSETSVSNDLAVSNIAITDRAEKPWAPSAPQIQQLFLLSLTAGLFLAISMAFFLDYLDSSVKTTEDISSFMYLPTLGIVPHVNSVRRRIYGYHQPNGHFLRHLPQILIEKPESLLLINQEPLSLIAEAYRSIRTKLVLSNQDQPHQVILMTSAQPAEGKTISTVNLGIALANNGHSVLVVDADLRRGICHRLLGTKNTPGLTDVLVEHVELEKGIKETAVTGLWFLSRGRIVPNPADLLSGNRMKQVIEELRGRFDFVLIDSPPAIAVSDAAIISTICDGVVLVVRSQRTSRETARRVMERLQGTRTTVIGAILNAVDIRNPDYVDYRHYYSHYALKNHDVDERVPIPPPPVAVESDGSSAPLQAQADSVLSPIAKFVIRDHIASLGESSNKFPRSRWQELVVRVSEEILNPTIRDKFQTRMARYLNASDYASATREVNEPAPISPTAPAVAVESDGSSAPLRAQAKSLLSSVEFLDYLLRELIDSMGPIAKFVIRDHIAFLGESSNEFPRSRWQELVVRVSEEILNPTIRDKFQTRMAQYLNANSDQPRSSA